ncbi:alpha/beta hydrolase [Chloroflexota bacterium]
MMITRDVNLQVEDINIVGRLYLPDRVSQAIYPVVCVCHGIPAGSPPDPSDGGYPLLAERICYEGFAVFIFNFRGTGASGGNLDMLGWTRDLKAAVDYLCALPEVDQSHLSLLGFSAGAAVSVYTASDDTRISSVVACACPAEFRLSDPSPLIDRFRSIGAIRDKEFPHSSGEWINGFRLVNPIKHVDGIAPRSLLLVHGNRDEVVNISQAYKLYARAGEPKQIVIVDGAGHRLRQNDRTMAIVMDRLKSRYAN